VLVDEVAFAACLPNLVGGTARPASRYQPRSVTVWAAIGVCPTGPICAADVIGPRIARRGVESSARLGLHRWKVERSLSWLSCFRQLQVRWDPDSARWFAFVPGGLGGHVL